MQLKRHFSRVVYRVLHVPGAHWRWLVNIIILLYIIIMPRGHAALLLLRSRVSFARNSGNIFTIAGGPPPKTPSPAVVTISCPLCIKRARACKYHQMYNIHVKWCNLFSVFLCVNHSASDERETKRPDARWNYALVEYTYIGIIIIISENILHIIIIIIFASLCKWPHRRNNICTSLLRTLFII